MGLPANQPREAIIRQAVTSGAERPATSSIPLEAICRVRDFARSIDYQETPFGGP